MPQWLSTFLNVVYQIRYALVLYGSAGLISLFTPVPAFQALMALAIVIVLLMIGLWIVAFFAIDLLTNDMSKVKPTFDENGVLKGRTGDRIYFFTEPIQGRAKIVLRGSTRIIRIIMNAPGLTFTQEGDNLQHFKHWWIRPLNPGEPEWPVERLSLNPWSWWKYSIYKATGKVFVGIYPWQQLHYYPFSRLKQVPDESAHGKVTYVVKDSMSDHVRVYPFQRFEDLPDNITAGFFKVAFVLNLVARVVNPVLAAYGQDTWLSALDNAARTVLRKLIKIHALSYLLSRSDNEVGLDDTTSREMAETLRKMSDEVEGRPEAGMRTRVGIEIDEVQIISALPQTSTEEDITMRAPALAEFEREAMITRKKGEAAGEKAVLEAQIIALKEGGEYGLAVLEKQKLVEAAQGGHATIFVGADDDHNVARATMAGVQNLGKDRGAIPVQNNNGRSSKGDT